MQINRNFTANSQNDEAFMTLLSSQRALLTELKRETALRGPGQMSNASPGRQFEVSEDPSAAGNRSMFDRRSSMDMLLSKRLSLGLGSDGYMLPGISFDCGPGDWNSMRDFKDVDKKRSHDKLCDEDFEVPRKRKKRRLSSLGFLSPTFFEDHLERPSRRNSLLSLGKPETKEDSVALDLESKPEKEGEDAAEAHEPLDLDCPKVDPEKMKSAMEAFRAAMEKSQNSQQSIHDWDRKMGLKKSHSKTMREVTRSRKKLGSVMKAEIAGL